ncbi:hypothetical protein [Catellatospora vulcania]|uniref:hypothetical protein n=1 Tax=Catellatospora vulcania TaxID=1460450 RepID=UPI0012D3AA3F|nr:hypothetical protein [Catellatospora vulcania]
MKRHQVTAAALAVAAVLSVAACGESSPPAGQEQLDGIADAVTAVGKQRFPDVFAGVFTDVPAGRVIVWRKSSAEFDAAVAAQPWAAQVRLRDAAHSAGELAQVRTTVTADDAYWRSRGLELNLIQLRYDGECVEVGTIDPDRAETEMTAKYGESAPLCFFESQGRAFL